MLEVVGIHGGSMGANARRALDEREFRIGREPDNDWVFPQSYVSRHQAVIRCVNGMYFLEQLGRCPITMNGAAKPLERNQIARLSAGDQFVIDDIEVQVTEVESVPEAAPEARQSSALDILQPPIDAPLLASAVDPLELLGGSGSRSSQTNETVSLRVPDLGSFLDEAMAPMGTSNASPQPSSAAGLSDDWFAKKPPSKTAPVITPPRRSPPPSPPPPPPSPSRVTPRPASSTTAPPQSRAAAPLAAGTLEELLRGAGIDAGTETLSPEVARQLGEVLRIVVEGTMQVLQARNDIRKEFRLPTTQVARRDNNPLKFSADVADALHKLLVQRSAAYLDTVSSFEDAFDDIRAHQLVMLESLRMAFDHMLRQFDPERLQEQFGKAPGRGPVLGLGGKPKAWEAYIARYAELAADRDFAFRKLFGEEFGRAYEQNLERHRRMLKASRRTSGPARSGGGDEQ